MLFHKPPVTHSSLSSIKDVHDEIIDVSKGHHEAMRSAEFDEISHNVASISKGSNQILDVQDVLGGTKSLEMQPDPGRLIGNSWIGQLSPLSGGYLESCCT